MTSSLYACKAPYEVSSITDLDRKGICVDDTTFWHCSEQIPGSWPNARQEPVTSLRLFKPWHPTWGDDGARKKSWSFLKKWVTTNNAKLLMGTEVTCDADADDQSWKWNLELMELLGKEHILGVAVGNEMDIFVRRASKECNEDLWNGRYWETLKRRVQDMDEAGLEEVKVTIVWAMSVLGAKPWKEDAEAKVNTLVTQAFEKWGDRWVWTFNVYSIWDSNFWPHSNADCAAKTKESVSIHYTKAILKAAREHINMTTGSLENPMWVGENGWSSPVPDGHPGFPFCPQYDSIDAFRTAYENFLSWDLSLPDGLKGPEHAFYFTMRDAYNGGAHESFGLIKQCNETRCKIYNASSGGEEPDADGASVVIL